MAFQSPSAKPKYGSLCFFLPPCLTPPPFSLGQTMLLAPQPPARALFVFKFCVPSITIITTSITIITIITLSTIITMMNIITSSTSITIIVVCFVVCFVCVCSSCVFLVCFVVCFVGNACVVVSCYVLVSKLIIIILLFMCMQFIFIYVVLHYKFTYDLHLVYLCLFMLIIAC